ncbi:MAG: hypothetical protein DRQ65_04055 [Gammaproteobacteria bacterium]|nr:MAG: hypothetical protein DRQ65_04055 [Gammaproteobacteria bacterium]RLA57079.1 MAG: hypothetical protein DRQ98_00190 [Gammaproteobacteria bacterium]HDY83177.1 protein BatD [Halieaceae bacterium]
MKAASGKSRETGKMMKSIGKAVQRALAALCTLALILGSSASYAAVNASLDRDRVAMGDTLRLTITVTGNEELNSTDLRPLLADFEILQRATNSNTSITNGRRSHTKQLLIDIMPRREGTLKIPPMRVGQSATKLLLVSVSPAPDSIGGGQTVLFEAEVDSDTVYVQGQVILTLRVQQAVNLDGRSITELQMDNAFVKPLEQHSFQRTIDGRPWLVHEVRYAIFPEHSGTLEIPSQTFSAREGQARRGFFDLNGGGRQLRRTTEPLTIEVLPRPDTFPAGTWLPARNLTLEESWSTAPEQLRAGESATRTIRILGEGLQGAQLPPVMFPATEGIKYYPDQPVINDVEMATGLLGSRQDSTAVVPTRAGTWTIPRIRIPWWDIESGAVRYAVLPGREITVAAADPATSTTLVAAPEIEIDTGTTIVPPEASASGDSRQWQILSAVSSMGWILTLAYLLWSRRKLKPIQAARLGNPAEKTTFKQLLAACTSGSALRARGAVIDWAAALLPEATVVSLSQVAAAFADRELTSALAALDTSLYGSTSSNWDGTALGEAARRLRRQHHNTAGQNAQTLQLYGAA